MSRGIGGKRGHHYFLGLLADGDAASVTPKTSRDRFSPPPPCTMALYLQSPGHGYVVYGIEGGP
jgi:hypothetical protein